MFFAAAAPAGVSRLPGVTGAPLPISFMSDFGLRDEFVGVVHGVIASLAPQCRVIDLNHGVPPGDIRGGALTLLRAIQYMPPGVALAVVDPGVGTDRRAVAAETDWGFLVGPDNGLLSPAAALLGGAGRVFSIENPEVMLPSASRTFEGRDRFAPAAALLASGGAEPGELGPEIDPRTLTPLLLPLSEVSEGRVEGVAWWVDGYGNVQTNISPEDMAEAGMSPGDQLSVQVGPMKHRTPWADAYADAASGRPLLHVDSAGLMALAVRGGRADEHFTIGAGTAVSFIREQPPAAARSTG